MKVSKMSPGQIALTRAINTVGGVVKLAEKLNVTRAAIYDWLNKGEAPVIRALQIASYTGESWRVYCPEAAACVTDDVAG